MPDLMQVPDCCWTDNLHESPEKNRDRIRPKTRFIFCAHRLKHSFKKLV